MEMNVRSLGKLKIEVSYGDYKVMSNHSVEGGGDGTAPNPFELFIASIAACSGYYAYSFCNARNIPTENITVKLTADMDAKKKMVEDIHVEVQLPPEFPVKYEASIIKAVEFCTVKRHLESPPAIHLKTAKT